MLVRDVEGGHPARIADRGVTAARPGRAERRGPWRIPVARAMGVAAAVLLAAVWCWATLRLVTRPAEAGPVEMAVTAGGWGLSLLPVHCVPKAAAGAGPAAGAVRKVTRAWRHRRWGAGSGLS
ncbi:hypothetical protein [Streptomyces sp. bgisy100]|uniref:hypothetical protein n=1 Tax=Streptomyces sp. bgisy100 TaxID=3413783 RepID=UPI003D74F53A